MITCLSDISGRWNTIYDDDVIMVGDVVLIKYQNPFLYEIKNKCNLGAAGRGVNANSHYIGMALREAREKDIVPCNYYVWRRMDADRPSAARNRLPLNPIFSKPLPLP